MTAQPIEAPYVELLFPKPRTALQAAALTAANASNDPEEVLTKALLFARMQMMREVRERLADVKELNEGVLRTALNASWLMVFPGFHRVTGPMLAEVYFRAYRSADAGDVPPAMVYALAEDHAKRMGDYFNETSADALAQGFTTFVNRKVPERAALNRVLEAYGLTPRQMSGFTSAVQLDPAKVESARPRDLKTKLKNYITKSLRQRFDTFSKQEAHNIDEQAQQVVWLWLVEKNRLPRTAEKVWITAKDEKVCTICGPLHRATVPVLEQFQLPDGQKLYTPGAHVNCRCTVRLRTNLVEIGKDAQFERKIRRDKRGRFADKPDVVDPRPVPRGAARLFRDTQAPPVKEQPRPQPDVAEAYRQAMALRAKQRAEREAAIEAAKPRGFTEPPAEEKGFTSTGFRGGLTSAGFTEETKAPQQGLAESQQGFTDAPQGFTQEPMGFTAESLGMPVEGTFTAEGEQYVAPSFDQQVAALTTMIQAEAERKPKIPTVRQSNATRLKQRKTGEETPHYYIAPLTGIGTYSQDSIRLDNALVEASSPEEIAREVATVFRYLIKDKRESILDSLHHAVHYGEFDLDEGEDYAESIPVELPPKLARDITGQVQRGSFIRIDQDRLETMLREIASKDQPGAFAYMMEDVYGPDGHYVATVKLPLKDFEKSPTLDISEGEFDIAVVELDRAIDPIEDDNGYYVSGGFAVDEYHEIGSGTALPETIPGTAPVRKLVVHPEDEVVTEKRFD